jgi:mannose-1-phosphate guanylyltransferase
MLCGLIMAGGKGERFWPLSTDEKPKQFLKLLGEETMLQMTVKRLEKLIPLDRIFIVTGKRHVEFVKVQLPLLPEKNIIIEPVGKNTAPCIALSAFVIEKYYKDSTIAVLPSDHLIEKEDEFINILKASYKFVQSKPESIVTIGMKPNRPETGYGYIEQDKVTSIVDSYEIRKVQKFVEKPNLETAKLYVEQGNFLWNGGMFIWKTDTILKLTQKYLGRTYEILNEIAATKDDEFELILEKKYNEVDSISVDYGIMEKSDNIYVIPGDFGWDDVGTWHSVDRIRKKDSNKNVCSGDIKVIDSHDNIIMANSKPIVVAGLDNIFVAENDEFIFIGSKDIIDNIKDIKNGIDKT